jgi:1-deoxy-D-xylulose-5-phosphate reductoisomerase
MKQLSILGSTGSIGRNTLSIVEMFPDHFGVTALAARTNIALLADQITQFRPKVAVVFDQQTADELQRLLPDGIETTIKHGTEGYCDAATLDGVDTVVTAVVGAAGLLPTLAALEAGKHIALANKETLVMAGDIVTRKAAEKNVAILPVDSEHSAIFQCLAGNRREDLDRILLTASGGPFLDRAAEEFATITPEDALKHPNWQMGAKITIDSATLMNKGLEVIEAKWLFGVSLDQIEVLIHPQSIIHSMVAYRDGSIMAQLGIPDMKGAIACALSWPKRLPLQQALPDFSKNGPLTFRKPDFDKFPCLALAYQAAETGGTMPAVLNAANEVAVEAFLQRQISFIQIAEVVRRSMESHTVIIEPVLSELTAADDRARQAARDVIDSLRRSRL